MRSSRRTRTRKPLPTLPACDAKARPSNSPFDLNLDLDWRSLGRLPLAAIPRDVRPSVSRRPLAMALLGSDLACLRLSRPRCVLRRPLRHHHRRGGLKTAPTREQPKAHLCDAHPIVLAATFISLPSESRAEPPRGWARAIDI